MTWNYSQKTTDLFMAAVQGKTGTHLGEIENPDGLGEHGSITSCSGSAASGELNNFTHHQRGTDEARHLLGSTT